ncbi:hypothetical protein ACFL0D_08515 [Thermoproteota archaeon]
MSTWHPTQDKILVSLSEGVPLTSNQIVQKTGLTKHSAWSTLKRCWENGLILRSQKPIFESKKKFRGRKGYRTNTRSYYKYIINSANRDKLTFDGTIYINYSDDHIDPRSARKESKAQRVLKFLREKSDSAYFSKDIFEALEHTGVKVTDIMPTVRRYGNLVYVRGYRSDDRQTPFKEGYLLTWLDQTKPREQAIQDAIERTDRALQDRSSTNPVIERVHGIRDRVIGSSKLRELIGVTFLLSELGLTIHELETAIEKTKQLYPDIKEVKLFNAYRYFYHDSLTHEDLNAATVMKENYIRKVKGRANRIGHNWEAVPEWFIDTFTTGARFWTQEHRGNGMDPRRITIHLIKPVGKRRRNAEVDRVWEVTPGVFAQPITYILECKWGLVRKYNVDDFFEVLRWSKEFGVDTPKGRQVRQGVIGVFAGQSFDTRENVTLEDESQISLASYAQRMNIQLLKAVDFNQRLRERGIPKYVTVQKICRASKNEADVRETLEKIWNEPESGRDILSDVISFNKEVFEFEQMLEDTGKMR